MMSMTSLKDGYLVLSRIMDKDVLKGFLLVHASGSLVRVDLNGVNYAGYKASYKNAEYDGQYGTLVGTHGNTLTKYPSITNDMILTSNDGIIILATILDADTKKPIGVVAYNGLGGKFNLTYKKLNELTKRYSCCNFEIVNDKDYGLIAVQKDGSYFETIEMSVPNKNNTRKENSKISTVIQASNADIPVIQAFSMDFIKDSEFSQSCQDKLVRTMLNMQALTPYYSTILQAIRRVPAPDFDTMGVTEDTLYYDMKFVANLQVSELTFVLIHEIMHIAMQHSIRFGTRQDHDLWNVACDLYINSIICNDFGCKFGGEAVNIGTREKPIQIKAPDFGVFIETIGEKIDLAVDTPESIYNKLLKENKGGSKKKKQQSSITPQQLIEEGLQNVQKGADKAQQHINQNGTPQARQQAQQVRQQIQQAIQDITQGMQSGNNQQIQQGAQQLIQGIQDMNNALQQCSQNQQGQGQGQNKQQIQQGIQQVMQGAKQAQQNSNNSPQSQQAMQQIQQGAQQLQQGVQNGNHQQAQQGTQQMQNGVNQMNQAQSQGQNGQGQGQNGQQDGQQGTQQGQNGQGQATAQQCQNASNQMQSGMNQINNGLNQGQQGQGQGQNSQGQQGSQQGQNGQGQSQQGQGQQGQGQGTVGGSQQGQGQNGQGQTTTQQCQSASNQMQSGMNQINNGLGQGQQGQNGQGQGQQGQGQNGQGQGGQQSGQGSSGSGQGQGSSGSGQQNGSGQGGSGQGQSSIGGSQQGRGQQGQNGQGQEQGGQQGQDLGEVASGQMIVGQLQIEIGLNGGQGQGQGQFGTEVDNNQTVEGDISEDGSQSNSASGLKEVNVVYNGKKIKGVIMKDIMSNKEAKNNDDVKSNIEASKRTLQKIDTKIKLEEQALGQELVKNAGAGGQLVKRYIEFGLSTGVDWRVLLRNMCKDKPKKTFTLAQPNQDYMNMGMTIADRRPIGKPTHIAHVKFAIDISSSVSQRELSVILSEINNIYNHFKVDGELIYWSTMVGNAGMFSGLKDLLKIAPISDGGTDVKCVFEYLCGETKVNKKAEPDKVKDIKAVFILTDGCFSHNYEKYAKYFGKKVIWLITGKKGNPITFNPLFGRVIGLDI